MVGSTIKVVATAENGNTFSSDETEEVGVYEALEILTADQKGEKEVEVTFSAPVDAKDKIEVTKGGNKVECKSSLDSDKLSAELTFTDAITAGTYTVTLTPADTTVDPSSVTFEGQRAVLDRIEFLNDVLVMKDQYYNEGYAYVKGYDQFDNPKTLSGLNVISGVGTFKSYDNETGKITIIDPEKTGTQTGAFLTIKEVPVFVQYQEGSNVIAKNETLTVSTRAYVADMEFGDIKKNSTETAKRLTLDELKSGLWYVEINDAIDQYGNALSADDLQNQAEENVLFVIPGKTGAFYNTGKFGTLKGQTVLWLRGDGDPKPGKMDLTITGAGGTTFRKENVEIFDNPYIDTLTVDYPDLYEGMTESKRLNFSAVDQYVDDVDLWDFRPSLKTDATTGAVDNTKLVFGDKNGMTGVSTEISVSGGAFFNVVENDTKAKDSKVTVNVGAMEAKQMAVFTITTAGTKVRTKTITIGERGKASVISNNFNTVKTLDPTGTWNLNKELEFIDVNGNVMTRNKNNTLYPFFIDGDNLTGVTDNALKNDTVIDKYLWAVSESKLMKAAEVTAAAKFDDDGVVSADPGKSKDYYITVFAVDKGGNKYIIDSQSIRVSNKSDVEKKVDVIAPTDTLYADPSSGDSVSFKVRITNEVGETYDVAADSVSVGGIFANTTKGAKIEGNIGSALPSNTTATIPVSVYYNHDLVGSVDLKYSNVAPVATKTVFKYDVAYIGDDGTEKGRAGATFDNSLTDTEFTTLNTGATYEIKNGVLTIINANNMGDTFTASVQDQYGQNMPGTVFYLNGKMLTSADKEVPTGRNVWEFKNDTQGKAFYMTEKSGADDPADPADDNLTVSSKGATTVVTTSAELIQALKAAAASDAEDIIEVTGDITLGAAVTVPENDTLVIPYGLTVDTNHDVTVEGTVRGTEAFGDNTKDTAGTLHIIAPGNLIGGAGKVDLGDNSLKLDGATVTGSLLIAGHIAVSGDVVFEEGSNIQFIADSTNIEVEAGGSLVIKGGLEIVADAKGTAVAAGDEASATVEITKADGSTETISQAQLEAAADAESGAQGSVVITDEGGTVVSEASTAIVKQLKELPTEEVIGKYTSFNQIAPAVTDVKAAQEALGKVEGTEQSAIVTLAVAEGLITPEEEAKWADVTGYVDGLETALEGQSAVIVTKSAKKLDDDLKALDAEGSKVTIDTIKTDLDNLKDVFGAYCRVWDIDDADKDTTAETLGIADEIAAAETAIEVDTFLTTYDSLIKLDPAETAYLTEAQMELLTEALEWFDEAEPTEENPELSDEAKADERITAAKAVLDALEEIMEDQTEEAGAINTLKESGALAITATASTAESSTFDVTGITINLTEASATPKCAGMVFPDGAVTFSGAASTLNITSGAAAGKVITISVTTALGNKFDITLTLEDATLTTLSGTPGIDATASTAKGDDTLGTDKTVVITGIIGKDQYENVMASGTNVKDEFSKTGTYSAATLTSAVVGTNGEITITVTSDGSSAPQNNETVILTCTDAAKKLTITYVTAGQNAANTVSTLDDVV